MYPSPPFITSTFEILYEDSIVISGEIYAIGLKVLSEAYSNPWFKILTSFILPISSDFAVIYAPVPSEDITSTNVGNFL